MSWVKIEKINETWFCGDTPLNRVHWPRRCSGQVCVVHSPTEHGLSSWPLVWREDRGIVERLCTHGIGHPDPDQFTFWLSSGRSYELVHGCDGCCDTRSRPPVGA